MIRNLYTEKIREEKIKEDKRITKRRGGDRRGEHTFSTPLHSHRKE
jgi:hypothetical protein